MITVGHAYTMRDLAERAYGRDENAEILNIIIKNDSVNIAQTLSVPQAKQLAKELLEWTHEFEQMERES